MCSSIPGKTAIPQTAPADYESHCSASMESVIMYLTTPSISDHHLLWSVVADPLGIGLHQYGKIPQNILELLGI
jgi:hypothetical protein